MSKHIKYTATARRLPTPKHSTEPGENILDEILARVRRIETKTTKYFEAKGFDTGGDHAKWLGLLADEDAGRMNLPTPATSIKEVLATIPKNYTGEVDLYVGEELIATIYR